MSWNTILIVLDVIFVIAFVLFLIADYENYVKSDPSRHIYLIFEIIGIVLIVLSIIQWAPDFFPWVEDKINSLCLFSKENWGPIAALFVVDILAILFFKYVGFPDLWWDANPTIVKFTYIFLTVVAFGSGMMCLMVVLPLQI